MDEFNARDCVNAIFLVASNISTSSQELQNTLLEINRSLCEINEELRISRDLQQQLIETLARK